MKKRSNVQVRSGKSTRSTNREQEGRELRKAVLFVDSGGLKKSITFLSQVEKFAANAVLVLKENGGFLPLPQLKAELERRGVGSKQLPYVLAFLLGYLESEEFNTPFEAQVFGPAAFATIEGKSEVVKAVLQALLHLYEG